jgi:hypothetical protein
MVCCDVGDQSESEPVVAPPVHNGSLRPQRGETVEQPGRDCLGDSRAIVTDLDLHLRPDVRTEKVADIA